MLLLSHLASDSQQVSSVSHSVTDSDDDEHHPCDHDDHVSKVSHSDSLLDDDNQHNQCDQDDHDDHPNFAILGRVDESEAVSELNEGKGEDFETGNNAEGNVEEMTAIQEESQTGASKSQERVLPQSSSLAVKDMVTGVYNKMCTYVHKCL